MKAHLNVEQAHEYMRARFQKTIQTEGWSLNEIFRMLDHENKSYLSVYDLEGLLMTLRKSNQAMEDVELLMFMYDRKEDRRITYLEFIDELTPK